MLATPADAEPVASCEENGVLGPIVGTVGSLAALETIKALRKAFWSLICLALLGFAWLCFALRSGFLVDLGEIFER